ncbi:hypothetical protein QBC45DRAFT_397882 [Copromyces sp. CBS 386.78]|uniref:Uncharacterized protein n=1 Tax=Pseudoneurospora amorphoporcata TaxID=241081 RepID=A0AAN6NS69_9PEZI|nr:hypothetical protein QBC45DRAFT_397882 [Copromyces sp. CBS 386.78]KAK3950896.1 hypothetical protein QBC32DRAFT_5982 [Pseudoneurospora amorphoporcata]
MESLRSFVRRSVDEESPNANLVNLMIALLVLVFCALLSVTILLLLKRIKQKTPGHNESLPQYHDDQKRSSNHRRLTISTGPGAPRSSVIVFKDGQPMLQNPSSPPHSPDNVPEIHITFPDEQDDQGRRRSGRVLVVRLGESTIGLEPRQDEQLPAYEKESNSQFVSVDIEKIGGLKEKEYR